MKLTRTDLAANITALLANALLLASATTLVVALNEDPGDRADLAWWAIAGLVGWLVLTQVEGWLSGLADARAARASGTTGQG